MPHAAFPASSDLVQYIRGANAAIDPYEGGFADLTSYCLSASDELSHDTGWFPFLQDAAPVARRFDPPGFRGLGSGAGGSVGGGQLLNMRQGLLSITSVSVNMTINSAGILQVQNQDYFPAPSDAPARGEPWTMLQFVAQQLGMFQSIQVTGEWGRVSQVPDSVWMAVMRRAAMYFLADYTFSLGPVQTTSDVSGASIALYGAPFPDWKKETERLWTATVHRFLRVIMGS